MATPIVGLPALKVSRETADDARNLADGAYFPLSGFLGREDFLSVLERMRLADGAVWSIPIVLDVNRVDYERLKNEEKILLADRDGRPLAILRETEFYSYDKDDYALKVFGSLDRNHPGVAEITAKGDYLAGGKIEWIGELEGDFEDYYFPPTKTREIFKNNNWKTVVAFQTRNVPHRSHEYVQKAALEKVDGLFVQPVIGKKKSGDFRDELIIKGYKILMDKYYPAGKYFFGILPIRMHYAGPREAVMHALIRRNYGCTHMIIGRDHAGVGKYYHPFAAHQIFDNFPVEDLGIEIMKFGDVQHCRQCGGLNFVDNCQHNQESRLTLSGTIIREMIKAGKNLPEELIRPEISEMLLNDLNPFVE